MKFSTTQWNDEFQIFKKLMSDPQERSGFLQPFLLLHAQVHPGNEEPSYADFLWEGASSPMLRTIPVGMEHSMVWCVWHIARIEDVVMNILIAGKPQIFDEDHWKEKFDTRFSAIGNEMTPSEIVELSNSLDTVLLHDYWKAVTLRTRQVVTTLDSACLTTKSSADRLQNLWDQGIIKETTRSVYEYWQSLTISGLLLMPPTRHQLIHLNEMKTILHKQKQKSTNQ